MAVMKCPKCGTEQPEAKECRKCGVIIAKYTQGKQSITTQTKPKQSYKSSTSNSVRMMVVILLSVVLFAGGGWYGFTAYQAYQLKKRIAKEEADDRVALQPLSRALQLLRASVQSGVTYEEYSRLVNEAVAESTIAVPKIIRLTDNLEGMQKAIALYQQAKDIWTYQVRGDIDGFLPYINSLYPDDPQMSVDGKCLLANDAETFTWCIDYFRQKAWGSVTDYPIP